jgi:AcrR family transcriptional regulator
VSAGATRREQLREPGAGADTRQRILAAAAQLFAERGYDGTSITAIASEVGVSAPALYYHFRSKEEILFRHLEGSMTELTEMCRNAVKAAGTDAFARLDAFVRSHLAFELRQRQIAPVMDVHLYGAGQLAQALPTEQRDRLRVIQRAFVDLLREVLAQGQGRGEFLLGDTTVTAFAIIGMVDHVVYWYRPGGRLGPDEIGAQFAQMARRMVTPVTSPHRVIQVEF